MRLIDADALIADCQLAQKQADRHGREFANAFYSGGGDISTEWWCVEDMIENAPTVEKRKRGEWIWDDEGYHCSECFFHAYGNTLECLEGAYKFCPNCGADLRQGGIG